MLPILPLYSRYIPQYYPKFLVYDGIPWICHVPLRDYGLQCFFAARVFWFLRFRDWGLGILGEMAKNMETNMVYLLWRQNGIVCSGILASWWLVGNEGLESLYSPYIL